MNPGSLILSQCRDLRMDVIWENSGSLTAVLARQFWICCRRYRKDCTWKLKHANSILEYFEYPCPIVIKINPYNCELYHFKVGVMLRHGVVESYSSQAGRGVLHSMDLLIWWTLQAVLVTAHPTWQRRLGRRRSRWNNLQLHGIYWLLNTLSTRDLTCPKSCWCPAYVDMSINGLPGPLVTIYVTLNGRECLIYSVVEEGWKVSVEW